MFRGRRAKTLPLAMLVIALALVSAVPASAATVTGTVVKRAQGSHDFVIASATGRLITVTGRHSPRVGQTVRVVTQRLTNGSAGVRRLHVVGRRTTVRVRGLVTRADRSRRLFTVSESGAAIQLRQRARGSASAASVDPMPAVGTTVSVLADIQNDNLVADQIDPQRSTAPATTSTPPAAPSNTQAPLAPVVVPTSVEFDGIIGAIDGQARTVTVNGSTPSATQNKVVIPVPFDMSQFHVGDYIRMQATRQSDGTLGFDRIVPTEFVDMSTTIVAIDGSSRVLTTRSCDAMSCGPVMSVAVPASVDLSQFHVGQLVCMHVIKRMDGTLVFVRTLTRSWQNNQEEDDD